MIRLCRSIALVLLALPLAGRADSQEAAQRYVRVTSAQARILNLADDKGVAIAEPEVGELLLVHEENAAGWLAVEAPGGFAVWVFGKYLTSTPEEGVFEVTRNAVNLRPGPSSEMANFPLPQRLHAGDRVLLIATLDPQAPLAETWARIWSPQGVRAWIRTAHTAPLPATEDGAVLWSAALAAAGERVVPRSAHTSKAAASKSTEETAAVASDAQAALDAAQAELETERQKDAPDFARIRLQIDEVLETNPSSATTIEARETLRRIDTLEEAASLKAELLLERERRARRAVEAQKEVWEASKKKDPLGQAFLSRGVLFRRRAADGNHHYFLRFGGETVAELACGTGRYDLEVFAGQEIGVQGAELALVGETPTIDVARIEVLKLR